MMCNGSGMCVNAEMNPCSKHGCDGLGCGDSCLMGDIMGWCDRSGECLFSGPPMCEEPEYTCAVNGKNGKVCEEKCCDKQEQYGITCHWDGSACADGEAPGSDYADCVNVDSMWKKGVEKKVKGKSAEQCYKLCLKSKGFKKGKKCAAWAYDPSAKKSCILYSKAKKSKSKSGVVSAKSNCHPTDGKQ